LRDKNPFLDSDIALIIETFEKGMNESRDEASVFVKFREDLDNFAGFPETLVTILDRVSSPSGGPKESTSKEQEVSLPGGTSVARIKDGTELTSRVNTSPTEPSVESVVPETPTIGVQKSPLVSESKPDQIKRGIEFPEIAAESEIAGNPYLEYQSLLQYAVSEVLEEAPGKEEHLKKVVEWMKECIPCDLRIMSLFDSRLHTPAVEFGDKLLDSLINEFEKLLNLVWSTEVLTDICSLANFWKFQCIPDLKRILWLLGYIVSQIDKEVTFDLGSYFDRLLLAVLGPMLSELLGEFNLLDQLILGPIRCIVDQIAYQMQMPQRALNALNESSWELAKRTDNIVSAERLKRTREKLESTRVSPKLDRAAQEVKDFGQEVSLQRLYKYMNIGMTYVKNKKEWIEHLINDSASSVFTFWNKKVSSSAQKIELLRLIGMLTALIKLAEQGGISCGPESGDLSEPELKAFIETYNIPGSTLAISIENDNLVIRNKEEGFESSRPSYESSVAPGRRSQAVSSEVGSTSIKRAQSVSSAPGLATENSVVISSEVSPIVGGDSLKGYTVVDQRNIVFQKPIASCLKKVTDSEMAQVQTWISELESNVEG
jgi:hypothetical protein